MLHYISFLPSCDWERDFPRRLCLLGSTGSIGGNALRVIAAHSKLFEVIALAAGHNADRLAEQAAVWHPQYLAVQDEAAAVRLQDRLLPLQKNGYKPEILVGESGYMAMASLPEVSTVLSAQAGAAALPATLAAARTGKVICLANKESLVLAGALLRSACAESGAVILPVDSEHNAIFQALRGRARESVKKLILTASGGPFWEKTKEELHAVTKEQALHHPNWKMGAKITIDSATMMNKGLEIIEAWQLYNVLPEQIEVLVHPQSIIHSMVEFVDGSQIAQLGTPDMRIPIAYCLAWPYVLELEVPHLSLSATRNLTFAEPDYERFPCLRLAREVLNKLNPEHPSAAAVVLNAANEVAVDAFLDSRIAFMDIPDCISRALDTCSVSDPGNLDEIEMLDHETRRNVAATLA